MQYPSNSPFKSDSVAILRLATPLVGGQIAVVGMTVTDIYMAGQYSVEALAAVQLGGNIWSMITLLIIGIMIGNNPIIGNYWGARQLAKLRSQFQQVVWLAVPMGFAAALGVLLGIFILSQLEISDQVFSIARDYLLPYLFTALLLPTFYAFRSTFEGVGDTRPVLVFNSIAFALNLVFDYALVFGKLGAPELGGAGAGWATLLVMLFLLACVAIYARVSRTLRDIDLYRHFGRPQLQHMLKTLAIGVPIALNIGAEFGFFAVIPLLIAHLGPTVIGAHAVAINIDSLAFMVPLSIAQALTILVAQAEGRGDSETARRICLTGFKIVFLLALVLSALKVLLRHDLAGLFSAEPEITRLAADLFLFAAVLGCVDCLQIACSGALRGFQDVKVPLLIQVVAFWVIAFPIAYSLALTDYWGSAWGVKGFWLGMIIAASCASIGLLARWYYVAARVVARG